MDVYWESLALVDHERKVWHSQERLSLVSGTQRPPPSGPSHLDDPRKEALLR